MPKAKQETVISESGGYKNVSVEVGQPDGTSKPATYTCFSLGEKLSEGWGAVVALIQSASATPGSASELFERLYGRKPEDETEESAQGLIVRYLNSSIDRVARQAAYEAAAQESTFITAGDEKVDIMTFPPARLVRGINGYLAQMDARMLPVELVAAKEPDAAKKAKIMADGRKDAEKAIRFGPWKTAMRKLQEGGKAKLNDATGMLELVA